MILTDQIRVLLVADAVEDATALRACLDAAFPGRFEVVHAAQLLRAEARLRGGLMDAVLIDLDCFDGNFRSTLQRLQSVAGALPFIALICEFDEDLLRELAQLGAQDYLLKGERNGHLVARAIGYAIERKRADLHLAYLAQYDSLTGLANRDLFRERLDQALGRADRSNTLVGLMFLDLDRFKDVNDTLGHDSGDQLLRAVTERLRGCVRETDTIARLGGDEFTIIIEGMRQAEDAATVARKVIGTMAAPFALDGHEVFVTTSIGITIYPLDDKTPDGLLKNADTALYRAKEKGRDYYQFYTAGMHARAVKRLSMESSLRRALERDEFDLEYQPKVDIGSRRIIGVEALLRWHHPERGLISPDEFIPLAEESGIIIPIGEWVVDKACRQLREWREDGLRDLCMAVNFSTRQFRQRGLSMFISDTLSRAHLDPRSFEIEITESMLMDDTELSRSTLDDLKSAGVRISVDDFGTGYSSLGYLKRLPIDTLKIDRSFVRDITIDADDAAIAKAIIALGHSLRLRVVAEGVETRKQLDFLREHGCDEAQGYLFSRSQPASSLQALFEPAAAPGREFLAPASLRVS